VYTVVVRNGVVIHAPGELDLGRTTRLANRAQRRALRALYRSCAIPGCDVRYDRCKLHHVVWWRNGGRTDLVNLLPLCTHHHSKVHDAGWELSLDTNRQLTVRFPDGTVRNTGPPSRKAA
jgi:predicted restriction endonuclease